MAGQGVAILTRALFAAELADGRLIQPFDLVGDDGHAYWLVYPEARRNVPKIRAFREWLLAEIAASIGSRAAVRRCRHLQSRQHLNIPSSATSSGTRCCSCSIEFGLTYFTDE